MATRAQPWIRLLALSHAPLGVVELPRISSVLLPSSTRSSQGCWNCRTRPPLRGAACPEGGSCCEAMSSSKATATHRVLSQATRDSLCARTTVSCLHWFQRHRCCKTSLENIGAAQGALPSRIQVEAELKGLFPGANALEPGAQREPPDIVRHGFKRSRLLPPNPVWGFGQRAALTSNQMVILMT